MRDVLEEQLAARLRDLGDVVPAELEPPDDLDARVAQARKSARARRYGAVLAVAAVFLVVVAIGTVLDGRTGDEAQIAVAPVSDPLPEGTVMLGAKGRYVTARDATGNVLATMVTTTHGNVLDAQVTADHKTIFYRVTDPNSPCDKIARADIDGRTSQFVARGDAFAINPDGTRLAVSGYGDLASGKCSATGEGVVAVLDLENGATTKREGTAYRELLWNGDELLVGQACDLLAECGEVVGWTDLQSAPRVLEQAGTDAIERGPDGLYQVVRSQQKPGYSTVVLRTGAATAPPIQLGEVSPGFTVRNIVPTESDLFVVASAPGASGDARLFRLDADGMTLVSDTDPGATSPVFPIP
jgi:hypothetical protein